MNPVVRFVLRAFEFAAVYYTLSRALMPGEHTPAGEIPRAALWGVIMQILVARRQQQKDQMAEPFTAESGLFLVLAGLVAAVAYLAGITTEPARAQLVSAVGSGVFLLAIGVVVLRRRRARMVAAGT